MTAALLALALVAAFLLALLVAIAAALLARMDGATVPAALLRGGRTFGGALTLLVALLALGIGALG
ncbi:hypothetical protein ACEZCY_34920 [Streptacidiphilus sp. N1-12]|uniref:Uncharacterized protein n=2 Tax=Streptacidiphilus alkalitolerans TaxID=3342712 RepID=A0ABV6XC59_9ACTN